MGKTIRGASKKDKKRIVGKISNRQDNKRKSLLNNWSDDSDSDKRWSVN